MKKSITLSILAAITLTQSVVLFCGIKVESQTITQLRSIVVVRDVSGSMSTAVTPKNSIFSQTLAQRAEYLVDQLRIRAPKDDIALLVCDETCLITVAQAPTNASFRAVNQAFSGFIGAGTNLFGVPGNYGHAAIESALSQIQASAGKGAKSIVIVTDGNIDLDKETAKRVASKMRQANVHLYIVAVEENPEDDSSLALATDMAESTGGGLFKAPDVNSRESTCKSILNREVEVQTEVTSVSLYQHHLFDWS